MPGTLQYNFSYKLWVNGRIPAGARNRIKATVKIRRNPLLQILPLIRFGSREESEIKGFFYPQNNFFVSDFQEFHSVIIWLLMYLHNFAIIDINI